MDATAAIELYRTLFYVSMAVAIMGLLAAVALFFLLDIPTVFALMTGRAKRKNVERIAQESKAGQIHNHKKKSASHILTQTDSISGDLSVNLSGTLEQSEELLPDTSLLKEEESETTLLSGKQTVTSAPNEPEKKQEPEKPERQHETMTLQEMEAGATAQLKKTPNRSVQIGKFEITEFTVIIHTEEIVL